VNFEGDGHTKHKYFWFGINIRFKIIPNRNTVDTVQII